MTAIDYFAWAVLIVIVLSVAVLLVAVAMLPGKVARARGHPQADAITVAGWLGLILTLGVIWVLAMIWAFVRPTARQTSGVDEPARDDTETVEDLAEIKARIALLEARLDAARGAAQ